MESKIDQLERLAALHRTGSLTDAEYEEQKSRLLVAPAPEKMVFCRACGSELASSAPSCPSCGAVQSVAASAPILNNGIGKQILWCAVWTIIFWIGSLLVVGTIAGALDPENGAAAGGAAGRALSSPLFFAALATSLILSAKGRLPGAKRSEPSSQPPKSPSI